MNKIKINNFNLNKVKMSIVKITPTKHTRGDSYVGDRENGKMHGEGTYYYKDGSIYIGQWKNNKMDGEGTFTWASGGKICRLLAK